MKQTLSASLLIIASASVTPALASDLAAGKFAVGIHGGTSGLGLGATYNLTDRLNLRGMVNRFDYDYDTDIDDFNYDFDLKLSTVDLMLDWHVFGGGFRLTTGLVSNGNELTGRARPRFEGTVEFGGQQFSTDDVRELHAKVDFDSLAPYLGIGFGNVFRGSRWTFTGDLGVLFQGSPNATVRAVIDAELPPAIRERLDSALAAEAAAVEDELKMFRYYPVMRLGLTYRF